MAEMQLTTDERLKLTYEMRVPQIIELLDMSEQTLQKVRAYRNNKDQYKYKYKYNFQISDQ